MLKRIASLLLLLSFAFAFSVAEEIENADIVDEICSVEIENEIGILPLAQKCSHDEYELIGDPATVTPTTMEHNDVYHKVAKVMTAICMNDDCVKKVTIYVNTRYVQHAPTAGGDDHVDGTLIHRYYQVCDTCGFETYYEIRCLDCEH